MKYLVIIGCVVFGLCSAATKADAITVRLDDYRNPKSPESKAFNGLYLDGVKEGLIISSLDQKQFGQVPLFCIPPNLAMTVEQAEDIMMRFANKRNLQGNMPIGVALLGGLEETFPCEPK
jgi:hypothetical protein